jgi:hypothetical protein
MACALVAVALGACASEAEESVPEDEFVAKMAEAICSHVGPCCEEARLGHVVAPSCDSEQRDIWRASIDRGRKAHLEYDARAAARCIAEQREWSAACTRAKDAAGWSTPACDALYRGGKAALGAACESQWDCAATDAGPVECSRHGIEPTYTCAARKTVGTGTTPHAIDEDQVFTECEPDLVQRRDGRCRKRPALGESCEDVSLGYGDPCELGSVCDYANTKKCVTPVPIGGACTTDLQCEWLACVRGRCALRITYEPYCSGE